MKQMVVLSAVPWEPQPVRIQQIMSRLPQYRILYFNPPPSAKNKKANAAGTREGQGEVPLQPGDFISVYPLPPVSPRMGQSARAAKWGGRKVGKTMARVMQENGFTDDPIIWCCTPAALHALPHIPRGSVIYDASYGHLLGEAENNPRLLDEMEQALCQLADLVLVPSEEKLERIGKPHSVVRLLPGGVHFSLFNSVRDEALPFPDELFNVKNPIFGYVGGIDDGVDLTYIEAAARVYPDWSFVLIGPIQESADLRPLEGFSNVHKLGFRSHKQLPQYIAQFDVLINPARFKEGATSPLKLYEYLATGKPIVSTPHPRQVLDYTEVISIAGTHTEFIECCRKAAEEHDAWRERQRIAYAKAASWDARVAELLRIFTELGI